jgi:hypothetical protein
MMPPTGRRSNAEQSNSDGGHNAVARRLCNRPSRVARSRLALFRYIADPDVSAVASAFAVARLRAEASAARTTIPTRSSSSLLETEHEDQRVVDSSQLVIAEMGDAIAEVASVDRADHFAEHARRLAAEVDLRVEAG